MDGWFVHVFDHSFFAVTDDKGAFSIANVRPALTRSKRHEEAGVRIQEITVLEDGDVRVDFQFSNK